MTDTKNENDMVYFTRLHWIIFFGPFLALGMALALTWYIVQVRPIGFYLTAFALAWIAITWVTYYFSSITIKKRQVILRTGILVRQTVDIPLNKIETIDIRQSLLGSIMKYGSLVITGTGGTRHMIHYLQRPLTCRRYIEQLMNE